jgi:hypothetical protein
MYAVDSRTETAIIPTGGPLSILHPTQTWDLATRSAILLPGNERSRASSIDQTKSVEHRPGLVFYFRERAGFVVTRRPYCETVGVVVWGLFYERHHLLLAEHES